MDEDVRNELPIDEELKEGEENGFKVVEGEDLEGEGGGTMEKRVNEEESGELVEGIDGADEDAN